jgi:hypothetical protein
MVSFGLYYYWKGSGRSKKDFPRVYIVNITSDNLKILEHFKSEALRNSTGLSQNTPSKNRFDPDVFLYKYVLSLLI